MCFQSLMKDTAALELLFSQYSAELIALFAEIKDVDKKIVYIKSIIQAVLRVPEHLCDHNPEFFGKLFSLATDIDNTKH